MSTGFLEHLSTMLKTQEHRLRLDRYEDPAIYYLLRSLDVGQPMGQLLLMVKTVLITSVWLLSIRIRNDISKMFLISVTIPILMDVVSAVAVTVLEILFRFPDMDLLTALIVIQRLSEILTRVQFEVALCWFALCSVVTAITGHYNKKGLYSSFLTLIPISGVLVMVLVLLPKFVFTYILSSVIAFVLCASLKSIILKLACIPTRRMTVNSVRASRRLPYILVLYPLAFFECLINYSLFRDELVIIIDKFMPILILIVAVFFLPAYRESLCPCCCSQDDTKTTSTKVGPIIITPPNSEKTSVLQSPVPPLILSPSHNLAPPTEERRKTPRDVGTPAGPVTESAQGSPPPTYYHYLQDSSSPRILQGPIYLISSNHMYPTVIRE